MNLQHRQRLRELFDAAIEMEASDWAAFVAEARRMDRQLADSLESLLELVDETGPDFDRAVARVISLGVGGISTESFVGRRLAHYEIRSPLGAGGMGEVYRATDTRLGRDVAIKVLPVGLHHDQVTIDRLQREARTLASLDHPNIVTLHSVEEAEGICFLTMQLIEGAPLSNLIPARGFEVDRFLELALPLTRALAAAHEKGIIHRDLKHRTLW